MSPVRCCYLSLFCPSTLVHLACILFLNARVAVRFLQLVVCSLFDCIPRVCFPGWCNNSKMYWFVSLIDYSHVLVNVSYVYMYVCFPQWNKGEQHMDSLSLACSLMAWRVFCMWPESVSFMFSVGGNSVGSCVSMLWLPVRLWGSLNRWWRLFISAVKAFIAVADGYFLFLFLVWWLLKDVLLLYSLFCRYFVVILVTEATRMVS